MGYSVRTNKWRYTEWVNFTTREVIGRELYDHDKDSHETINLAAEKQYAQVINNLSKLLTKAMQD